MKLHNTDEDRIEKVAELKAPRGRVWRALTDSKEFGEWFGVALEGPFLPGERTRGRMTIPGYEHVQMEVTVQRMEPEGFFSYTWHPYAIEPELDYSQETPTLVEFHLEEAGPERTRLRVVESGFSKVPAERRALAFRKNSAGWEAQLESIAEYVGVKAPAGLATRALVRKQAPIFAALGDETRLALLARLSTGVPWSITELSDGVAMTRQAVTKHLRVLEGAGLVRGEALGRECRFQLEPARLAEARDYLGEVSAAWDGALERLRGFVEKG